MTDDKFIKEDRMRYTKNKASANLALVAILFDIFFFVNIYKSNVGSWYYNALIGASIIYNLLFLLAAFLSSEELKTYNVKYAWFIGALGVVQILRILILPLKAHNATISIQKVETQVMQDSQFIKCIVYLVVSGVACIAASVIGVIRGKALEKYISGLGEEARRD